MKKKIVFVLPRLGGGGAQRVIATLLNNLDKEKYEIFLVLFDSKGDYQEYLSSYVKVINLNTKRLRNSIIPLFSTLYEIKPDILFSTMREISILLISFKWLLPSKTRLICREMNTPSESIKNFKYASFFTWFYKNYYKYADLIICQSKYMLNDLKDNFNIPEKKLIQIYNPVDSEYIINNFFGESKCPFSTKSERINIVAIGRLIDQKGFDRLIDSIPQLLLKYPDANLWILGKGNLKIELVQQVEKLNLMKSIHFVEHQKNPFEWLRNADLFVLPSKYEGLPNILLEALCCECPVVSLKHPGGTYEIMELTGQKNRWVESLDWEEDWFLKPSLKIIESVNLNFGVKKIIQKYENVL